MKKTFLPLLILLFSLAVSAQTLSGYIPFHEYFQKSHGNIQKLGAARNVIFEEIGYSHDTYVPAGGSFTPSDSGVFYYNQDSNRVWQIFGTYYGFFNPTWDSTAEVIDSVTADGFVQFISGKTRVDSNWVNSYQYTYTYNTSAPVGYLNTLTIAKWNGTAWVDSIAYQNSNDSIGRLTHVVVQTGSTLQNDSQYYYYYNGWLVTNMVAQAWSGSAWVNVSNQYFSYDDNGNVVQSTGYTWNGTNWTTNSLSNRSYNAQNQLQTYYFYLWNPMANGGLGGYVNNYYEAYQYVLGNNTDFQNFYWDSAANVWTPSLQVTNSFDNNHNIVLEQDQQFAADTFGNTDLYYYYYNSYTVSGVNDLKNDLGVSIFPNPTSGNATVSLTTGVAGNIALNVYDDQGKVLKHQQTSISAGANQIPLNLSGLAAGEYFLQVSNYNGKMSVLEFVKQ